MSENQPPEFYFNGINYNNQFYQSASNVNLNNYLLYFIIYFNEGRKNFEL